MPWIRTFWSGLTALDSSLWITRTVFQRFLGCLYLVAFLAAANQIRPLIGAHGLLPLRELLKETDFWHAPSLFWGNSSDRALVGCAWLGVILSGLAIGGLTEACGPFVSAAAWGLLWLLYLSYVNVGQIFYGYGWESLLLETGFVAIFLGSRETQPPAIVFWMVRWCLFRVMFGAGMIKLRGDSCWRDLTCMYYHYETQPIPNPLSWYFHHLPRFIHRAAVLFNHFVELVVPWFVFIPGPPGYVAGAFIILFQGILILSGNLSFLNYLTILLCVSCFDDRFFRRLLDLAPAPETTMGGGRKAVLTGLGLLIFWLSVKPARNLISPGQRMNASFDPFHLVNTYGAFGSIGRQRDEVILEGTDDPVLTEATVWREYAFKAKPGDVRRMPPIVSPYHLRLDWQIWFAAMSSYQYQPWLINLVAKLLAGDRDALGLMGPNPFPDRPPRYIRALRYRYSFTDRGDPSGAWWRREPLGLYLPPLSLDNPSLKAILQEMGWN
jgi:hypothetical protein